MTVGAYFESSSGLTVVEVSGDIGRAWTRSDDWRTDLRATAIVERTMIAINDRPLSLFAGGRYDRIRDELVAEVGLRFAIMQRRDRRTLGTVGR